MSTYHKKLEEAIKAVFDDMDSLSDEEFHDDLDKYRDDSLTHLLLKADEVGLEYHEFSEDDINDQMLYTYSNRLENEVSKYLKDFFEEIIKKSQNELHKSFKDKYQTIYSKLQDLPKLEVPKQIREFSATFKNKAYKINLESCQNALTTLSYILKTRGNEIQYTCSITSGKLYENKRSLLGRKSLSGGELFMNNLQPDEYSPYDIAA